MHRRYSAAESRRGRKSFGDIGSRPAPRGQMLATYEPDPADDVPRGRDASPRVTKVAATTIAF